MENPVKAVTSGLNVSTVLKTLGILIAIFAVADFLGYSGVIISPYSFIKSKFGSNPGQ